MTTKIVREHFMRCTCGDKFAVMRGDVTIVFKGETYDVEEEYLKCVSCGNEADAFDLLDPLEKVYAIYREKHGVPTPEAIKAAREAAGMTLQEFANACLKCKDAKTQSMYECGALPPDHDIESIKAFIEQRRRA